MTFHEELIEARACGGAERWVCADYEEDPEGAWQECDRADWMIWYVEFLECGEDPPWAAVWALFCKVRGLPALPFLAARWVEFEACVREHPEWADEVRKAIPWSEIKEARKRRGL